MAANLQKVGSDQRGEHRDEVHFRTRGSGSDGTSATLLIVNISPNGLLVRSDSLRVDDDEIRIQLPVLGMVDAVIRWALGGRFGCQLAETIPSHLYHSVVASMR